MKGVGAVRNRALCGFASTLWARCVRPQVRQRPQPSAGERVGDQP